MDYYTRLIKYFLGGVLFALISSFFFAVSFAVDGLQGPFVPIGIESVHVNGNVSDVSVLYHSQTTGGADVFASATTPFTSAEAAAQAIKKSNDPNGGNLRDQLSDDGFNINSGGNGYDKDIEPDDPQYLDEGTCMGQSNVSLTDCKGIAQGQIEGAGRFWQGMKCNATGSDKIDLLNSVTEFGTVNAWGFWFAPTANTLCDDNPNGPLPDPGDPEPTDEEMLDELSNPNPPSFPPLAPNPRPQGSPPPMLSPEFYSESSSRSFDMSIPTAGPSFSDHSLSLTQSYDSYTSTTTVSAPLPSGMSFSQPEIGVPISTPTAVDGGTGGAGEGEAAVDTCVTNPNSVGCADTNTFIDSLSTEFNDLMFGTFDFSEGTATLTEEEQSVAVLTPVSLASAVCPTPPTVTIMGSQYTFENSYVCSGLALLHPIMILLATFSAALLIAGVSRGSA